ncbi:MAG: tetratricopeptide repeat protein [Myxococcales bacterium]|nr:tetratricopeptide repeat protein [Myxococcales bacterium]
MSFTRAVAVLLVVLLIVYAPGLQGAWLNFDDPKILMDPALQQPLGQALATVLAEPYDRAYYPLLRGIFWLQHAAGALTPVVNHALDLGLFAASAVGIGWLLQRWGLSPAVAGWAVALWALHPLRVESVAWMSSRKDVLSLALVVATGLLLWPESRGMEAEGAEPSGRRRLLASVCWLSALLSKSMVFPIAGVFWGVAWAQRGAAHATRLTGGLLALGLVDGIVARWAFAQGDVPSWPEALSPVGLFFFSHGRWLHQLVWPDSLAAIVVIPDAPGAWVGLGVAALLSAVAWAGWAWSQGDRWPTVLVGAWVLPMLPVSGMVPLAFWAADRYPLAASLAPAVGVAWGLVAFARSQRLGASLLGVAVCGALAVTSMQRVRDYRSSLALWEHDQRQPGEHVGRYVNLGSALGGAGRFEEALGAYRKAEAIAPERADVLAHRLFAEVVVGGWDEPRGAAAMRLEPPPSTPEQWLSAIEGLVRIEEHGLALEAVRGAELTGMSAADVEVLRGRLR